MINLTGKFPLTGWKGLDGLIHFIPLLHKFSIGLSYGSVNLFIPPPPPPAAFTLTRFAVSPFSATGSLASFAFAVPVCATFCHSLNDADKIPIPCADCPSADFHRLAHGYRVSQLGVGTQEKSASRWGVEGQKKA